MFKSQRFGRLTPVVAAALTMTAAHAQSTTQGSITGTVEDATGAAIPKAVVTIHNDGTNAEVQLKADDKGFFNAPLLQVGNYTVTVKAAGFGDQVLSKVVVVVGQSTTLEPHLELGTATQQVDVSAAASVINLQSPDFTSTLNQNAIEELPQNNRRWSSLALLTPGVVSDANGFGLVSVRGISPILNNILIDGADDNQAYYAEERGRTREAYSTSEDSVREFAVNTGVYSAEYGRAAGAVINSVTKSGTNQLHGEVYFYDRESNWSAYTPLVTNTTGGQNPDGSFAFVTKPYKPKDLRKIYGFGIGGPLIKDKLFFFYTFDQHRRVFPGTAKASTPSTFFALPDAATSFPTGATCSPTGYLSTGTGKTTSFHNYTLDAQVCALAAREGLTYAGGVTAYGNGLVSLLGDLGSVPRAGFQEINTPKLDFQINQKNRLAVLYHRLRWDSPGGVQTQATNNYAVDSFGNDFVKLDYGLIKLESQLSNSISNEIGYQYGRELDDESQQPYSQYTLNNLVGTGSSAGNVPEVALATGAGGFYLGSPYYSYRKALPDERKWQVFDTLYYVKGNHSFKFGYDGVHNDDLINNTYESNGYYSYTYTTNYLADQYARATGKSVCNSTASQYASSASATSSAVGNFPCYTSLTQGFGNPVYNIATYDFGVFAQDNWKLSPRLTLQLGVRYDYEYLPFPSSNLTTAATNAAGTQTFFPFSGINNRPTDKNNVGPRLGFSYDAFGTGKTVLRAGYGMFFGRTNNGILLNTLLNTGSPNGQFTTTFKPAVGPSFPNIVASGAASATPSAYYLASNLQNPMVHEFDMVLQQDLGHSLIFNLSYLGALGRELPNFLNLNLNPTTVTNDQITIVDATGKGPLPNGTVLSVPTYTSYGNTALFGASASHFQSITEVVGNINSSYNAFVAEVQTRDLHGLQFDGNYTWSHALDFNQNAVANTTSNNWYDPFGNQRANYGNSSYNVPNRFVGYVLYTFPKIGSGNYLKYVANGWQFNDTFQMQNGLPYSYNVSGYTAGNSVLTGLNGGGGATYLPQLGRNTLQLRRAIVDDIRLIKAIPFTERYNLELRADVFNIANHENVTALNTTAYNLSSVSGTSNQGTATYTTAFGTPSTINSSGFLYTPREVQISARFLF